MKKSYEAFFPDVLPDVPGITPDMALRAIRQSVIEFCEKSLIHQVTQDPISLIPNIDTYDLDAPRGYRVGKVMRAWYLGSELQPVAPDDMRAPDAYSTVINNYTPTRTSPTGFTQVDFDTVTFIPIPDQAYQNSVTLRVALVPLRDSDGCEAFLHEIWGELIACGAKARLQVNPGKPYTNAEAATVNQARFTTAINDARQRATRGNVRSDLMVKMRTP